MNISSVDKYQDDNLHNEAQEHLNRLVRSAGVERVAQWLGITARQVNRILSGASPNPIERLIRLMQCASPETGDRVLDYICQEMGGHFVRVETLDLATMNAVKECAEAIAALSDGQVSPVELREIREAISALAAVSLNIRERHDHDRGNDRDGDARGNDR